MRPILPLTHLLPLVTRWSLLLTLLATMIVGRPTDAAAQLPQARLYSIFPAGGQAGTTVDLSLTSGDDLDEVHRLVFNHPGLEAEQKTRKVRGEQEPIPGQFRVTIGSEVPPGFYEVRAVGLFGMSNPRTFVVGRRPEARESESNNSPEEANAIEFDTVINGRASGRTDVDFFRFEGQKGQRVLVTCQTSEIDSRLEATLALYDSAGNRVDYGYGQGEIAIDPVLDVTLPADGEYVIKLYDFVYGGGNEYVYRLKASTGPYVDYILPPAGVPGSTAQYTLYGRNLPEGEPADAAVNGRPLEKQTVEITLPDAPTVLQTVQPLRPRQLDVRGISYRLTTPSGHSNSTLIAFASAPVALEQEPNDEAGQAQSIEIPGEYAGQFQKTGDTDIFAFEAKAKEVYIIEVFGQRNGTTVDPFFVLERVRRNDQGEESVKRITRQDDTDRNLLQNVFSSRTDDPTYRFQVPADGTYRIRLRDRYFESRGDPRLVYRLAVRKPDPDFHLAVLPLQPAQGNNVSKATWSIGLRRGDNLGVEVLALRRDGFDEPIEVRAEGLPEGVTCPGAVIGPGRNRAKLVFTAAEEAPRWSGLIEVVGTARIEDQEKVRAVRQAQAAVNQAEEALSQRKQDARKAAQAVQSLQQAVDQLNEAEKSAKSKLQDDELARAIARSRKAVNTALQQAGKAEEQRQAATAALEKARAQLEQARAEREKAARELVRRARPATVVWNGDNNQPASTRLADTLGLSVLKESAPYQVTTEVSRVEANQNRQILVPVELKRRGFKEQVNLSLQGLPDNSNVDVQVQPLKKGKTEQVVRLFAKNNARPGTYTLYLKSQAQVNYRRNPERVQRAKAEQKEAAEALKQAQKDLEQAKQDLEEAKKQLDARQKALKQARTAQAEAKKKAQAAAEAVQRAMQEKKKADALVAALAEAEKQARVALEKTRDAVKTAGEEAGERLTAAEKSAEKLASETAGALKKAREAQKAAEKKLNDAQAAAKEARKALESANTTLEDARKAARQAEEARNTAETAVNEHQEKVKTAEAVKKEIDQEVQQAQKAAKPKKVNVFSPSTPFVVTIKPAPATLSASVPNGGNLKPGESLDLEVTVERKDGFEGPVTLKLPLPPGVKGLSAEPVTVPAGKKKGVLTVRATDDAPEGEVPNLVVRGVMDHEGGAAVDAPINLKIAK